LANLLASRSQTAPDLRGGSVLRPLAFVSDAVLVEGVRANRRAAIEAFYDRYSAHVIRVLGRVLGFERELADLHHEVFVKALESIGELRDPDALKPWLTSIAVFTARTCIQKRTRGRWLRFFATDELPDRPAATASDEIGEALRYTYWALDQLPAEERIAFALRIIDGMELTEVAEACGCSLATVKRRLSKAEAAFTKIARNHPVLAEWIEGGGRWGSPASH
jgi:RNA polymerase sigma-70 factor (ECF subfamily)